MKHSEEVKISKKEQLTILFADIVGSTRLYERLGDERARLATSQCLGLASNIVAQFGGKVIKTIGDELMCVFSLVDSAAETAIAIQEQMALFTPLSGLYLQMKIGFHHGEVIVEKDDVFGDAVNIAARMVGQAKAEQIIVTEETMEKLSRSMQEAGRRLKETIVHGKKDPVTVCELTWGDVSELTIMGTLSSLVPLVPTLQDLVVRFQEQQKTVNTESPLLTIGRGEQNGLVVDDPMVSRRHAIVEWRQGEGFFLTDQSTNGVYLQADGQDVRFLHRETMQLGERGIVTLGRKPDAKSGQLVHFAICNRTNNDNSMTNNTIR